MRQAERLAQPIFTPSTKAAVGAHDENIGFDVVVATIGAELAAFLGPGRGGCVQVEYPRSRAYARARRTSSLP